MSYGHQRYYDDEIDEFKRRRAMDEADEGRLVDAAMRDILAGRLDSEVVHEAMKLGHHTDYRKLSQALNDAERAARHAGTLA